MLRTTLLPFTFCLITFLACNKKQETTAVEEEDTTAVTTTTDTQTLPSKTTFSYKDINTAAEQELVVNWISKDTIAFTFAEKKDSCNVKEEGKAVNHFPDGDAETDEDENGEAYMAIEYIFENASTHLAIRISDDIKKAQIKYQAGTATNTFCIPTSSLVMNAR
jgi:hypothetical protein